MPARNLLAVGREAGPVQIDRKNMERITRVNADIETSLSEAITAVQANLSQVRVPPDFAVGFGAEVEEQARAFRQLLLVLVLAVLLVYAVMASQYESLRDPFIIMFSIPVAGIGVVLSLLVTGTAFNMQAFIGVIMLAGIVVSNAILLVDYINTLRRRDGMPLREAVEVGGRRRLRPILMTSFATMLGLVPMAIGLGEGGELQAPLARVVIGGLLASTMVTLVLVPAVYTLFEEGLGGATEEGRSLARASSAPVTGSTQSGAISASGSSTNRRSRNRGCGTIRSRSSMIVIPIQNQVEVERARRARMRPRRARTSLRSPSSVSSSARADSVVEPTAAAFRKRGCSPTPTGAVS